MCSTQNCVHRLAIYSVYSECVWLWNAWSKNLSCSLVSHTLPTFSRLMGVWLLSSEWHILLLEQRSRAIHCSEWDILTYLCTFADCMHKWPTHTECVWPVNFNWRLLCDWQVHWLCLHNTSETTQLACSCKTLLPYMVIHVCIHTFEYAEKQWFHNLHGCSSPHQTLAECNFQVCNQTKSH